MEKFFMIQSDSQARYAHIYYIDEDNYEEIKCKECMKSTYIFKENIKLVVEKREAKKKAGFGDLVSCSSWMNAFIVSQKLFDIINNNDCAFKTLNVEFYNEDGSLILPNQNYYLIHDFMSVKIDKNKINFPLFCCSKCGRKHIDFERHELSARRDIFLNEYKPLPNIFVIENEFTRARFVNESTMKKIIEANCKNIYAIFGQVALVSFSEFFYGKNLKKVLNCEFTDINNDD